MALATYSDLITSVANWTHRTDLAALVPDFVTMAEARISRDLRLRKQITNTTISTVAGTQSITIPTNWLEFENVSVNSSPARQLTYVSIEQLDSKFPTNGYAGIPAVYTIEGDSVLFGPTPDAVYSIDMSYYARFDSIITSSTNWLLTNHPSIYLFAVLIEAMSYIRDPEQLATYTNRYYEGVKQLQDQDDRATHSGSSLRVRGI